jgi:hypothetical protein
VPLGLALFVSRCLIGPPEGRPGGSYCVVYGSACCTLCGLIWVALAAVAGVTLLVLWAARLFP